MNKVKKNPKIIFKVNPKPKGLAAVGAGWSFKAKVKGKIFALCSGGRALNPKVTIQIAIKKNPTKEEPVEWKWVFVNHDCSTMEDCQKFLLAYYDQIIEKLDLYFMEDY